MNTRSFDNTSLALVAGANPVVAFQIPGLHAPLLCRVEYGLADQARDRVTGYRGVRLGPIDVFQYEGIGLHHCDRNWTHVRADGLSDFLITIPLQARTTFEQCGTSGATGPGSFSVFSTAQPFAGTVSGMDGRDTFSALHLRIVGDELRRRLPHAEDCCGRALQVRPGAGSIMQQMCTIAIDQGRHLSHGEATRYGHMLVDAIVNVLAEAGELQSLAGVGAAAHRRIRQEATAFIDSHLAEPWLDLDTVATHCRVSKRYLQAAFSGSGDTVCTTIREKRLQKCREDLRNPAQRHRSISQIALLWGFNDLPYFSRAYRRRFDCSPSQDREQASLR